MEEIGRRLREARVARGITLQEVEEETRIRKKYIEALESGRTVLIPGEVYVKGFLRTYGNFLGLDGEALVQEYKERKNQPAPVEDERPAPAEARVAEAEVAAASPNEPRESLPPRPPAFVQAPRRSSRSRSKRRQKGPGPGVYIARRILVALIVLLPLAGLGYWLWTHQTAVPTPQQGGTAADVTGSDTPSPAVAPEPEPEPEPESEQVVEQEPEPQKPVITVGAPRGEDVDITIAAPTIDLQMNFAADTWLEVYNTAGETLYFAKANGTVSFQGDGFRVRLGNVNSFELTLNGEPVAHGLKGGPYWINFKTE